MRAKEVVDAFFVCVNCFKRAQSTQFKGVCKKIQETVVCRKLDVTVLFCLINYS